MPLKTMSSTNVATVRTTVNTSLLALALALVAEEAGWTIGVNQLLPWMPLIIPVAAFFYRLSRYVASKHEWLGVGLFGINAPPVYVAPAAPLSSETVITDNPVSPPSNPVPPPSSDHIE